MVDIPVREIQWGIAHAFAYIASLSLWYIINQFGSIPPYLWRPQASAHIYPAWEHVEKWTHDALSIHLLKYSVSVRDSLAEFSLCLTHNGEAMDYSSHLPLSEDYSE